MLHYKKEIKFIKILQKKMPWFFQGILIINY